MTRELIIEGQQVDLAPDTDITLEYNGNVLGDIGKITLSHSYTIKIPRTARNARILDDPGNLGHASGATRRFLNARFFRNGIDLLGAVQAYLLKTTPDQYELALVWNTMPELQELSQSALTLNDLPGLPVLEWIHNGEEPDYTYEYDGALFARYTTGLSDKVVQVLAGAAPHPCMRFENLVDRILTASGIAYRISATARERMRDVVLLAAPSHAPTLQMEIDSGTYPTNVIFQFGTSAARTSQLAIGSFVKGWDGPGLGTDGTFYLPENSSAYYRPVKDFRLLVNMRVTSDNDLRNAYFFVKPEQGNGTILLRYFRQVEDGWVLDFDEDLSSYAGQKMRLGVLGLPNNTPDPLAHDPNLPMLAVMASHKTINTYYDNRFPLQGNLPNLKQWDFVKASAALFGLALDIKDGILVIQTGDERYALSDALDWTAKVDATNGDPDEIAYTLAGWAQRNAIAYKEDAHLNFNPNGEILVPDSTLPEHAVRYQLPFAASVGDQVIHYETEDETNAKDLKIEPRIFRVLEENGERQLQFTQDLYGEEAIRGHYARVQKLMEDPTAISINIRLHEIDLAQLDLTRPVYLGQFGHYYMIQKIQTSKTDLCKVSLIQLA